MTLTDQIAYLLACLDIAVWALYPLYICLARRTM